MTYEPHGAETAQTATLLANVPTDVFEVFGEEAIEVVETLSAQVTDWQALVQRPNPFEHDPSEDSSTDATRDYAIYDPEYATTLQIVSDTHEIVRHDPTEAAAITVLEEQAPLLALGVTQGLQALRDATASLQAEWDGLADKQRTLKTLDSDDLQGEVQAMYDGLHSLASHFPGREHIRGLRKLTDTERLATYNYLVAVGASVLPEVLERRQQIWRRKQGSTSLAEQVAPIDVELFNAGKSQWAPLEGERTWADMRSDEQAIAKTVVELGALRAQGSAGFEAMKPLIAEAILEPAHAMLLVLLRLEFANSEALKTRMPVASDPALYHQQALAAEDYLFEKAQQLVEALKVTGAKPGQYARDVLRSLVAEKPLRRAYEKQQKRTQKDIGTASLSQEVAPDQEFLQICSDAKKIVEGGNHLKHPLAANVARELHGIEFGEKTKVTMTRPEKGLIVAILTSKLASVLTATEHIQTADAARDPQVRFLRRHAPSQLRAIAGFDLRESVANLQQILGDPYCRNQLLEPLKRAGVQPPETMQAIERVRATVSELFQKHESEEAQPDSSTPPA